MTDQMPRAIAQLQLDHRNMTRLLDLLRRELDAYRAGQALDVDLLGSIMEYSLHYPDLCHHPLENLIYEKLVQRDPAAGAKVGDLTNCVWSYRLQRNIGFGLVAIDCAAGDRVEVHRHGQPLPASLCALPFL